MRNKTFIATCLIWAAACSCSGLEEAPAVEKSKIPVSFHARSGSGKSLFSGDESKISELNVWCYLDGTLDAEYYGPGAFCALRLYEGREYHVYALSNCGEIPAPALENDVQNIRVETGCFDNAGQEGLPMSSTGAYVCTVGKSPFSIELRMQRLVAKYMLKIKRLESTFSEFELKEVRIRNAATSVTPFKEGSHAVGAADGDYSLSPTSADGSIICLYIPENMNGDSLDRELCSYIELKGRLSYSDRPADNSVYLLDQNMTYRWYLRDGGNGRYDIRRNTSYSAEFTWTDFGWIADRESINVDSIEEDQTYSLTFCNESGVPVSSYVFEHSDKDSFADIYYKVYPESSASQLELRTNVPPAQALLTLVEESAPMGGGIFRTRFVNTADRAATSYMDISIANAAKGISCTASYCFKGAGNCIGEWERNDDENIGF